MLILDSSTKLQIVLAGAIVTNQSTLVISGTDINSSTGVATPFVLTATTNSTTAVDIAAAPASGSQRIIKSIFMVNADTAVITPTFRTNNAGTTRTVFLASLQVGDNMQYEDGAGWCIVDTNGQYRTSSNPAGRLIRAPQYLTAGTSYTIPTNCTAIELEMVGAGGGGGGTSASASNAAVGGGGGAGAYLRKYIPNPQTSAITYAIGTAGTAGANTGGTGGTGGSTTFTCNSVTYTAAGGVGGTGMTFGTGQTAVTGGTGGTATNGDINGRGAPGEPSIRLSGTVAVSGNGATSPFGGGGLCVNTDAVGVDGQGYGSGGSGSCSLSTAQTGGAGAPGLIIVREYY